ncbi:hypothetical protein COV24_04825 [candidate division WWE3 bacterium CG10_big_fil_rev_8_21_14_0_10_32_10]|uniref:Uncharacterized protein n=1 Tax=candidate division WWE3 bacterium CG10_big_fil_rev_8_21_14_0_10_32_10 TaxID=1975090 RepID=A0A2H0R981_UNCKA|nr:MAG: hypothetical protein COV24_04825 [candidate division WWE3 bacterium CG10_big_fil_rev_8_21_14_0_10_32_10]
MSEKNYTVLPFPEEEFKETRVKQDNWYHNNKKQIPSNLIVNDVVDYGMVQYVKENPEATEEQVLEHMRMLQGSFAED